MKKNSRALTLVESIISIFLLAAGFVIVSRCFHSALQISANVNTRTAAVGIAQKHIELVKAWSRLYHFPRGTKTMDEWDVCSTTYYPDSEDGRFQVATLVTNPDFYVPCTLFETAVESAPVNPNPMEPARVANRKVDVRRQITVVVNWGGAESVRLTTMIVRPSPFLADVPAAVAENGVLKVQESSIALQAEEPSENAASSVRKLAMRSLAPGLSTLFAFAGVLGEAGLPFAAPTPNAIDPSALVNLPEAPVTLHHDEKVDLAVKVQVGTTRLDSPPRFHWSVIGSGTGTLVAERDGRRAKFYHYYENQGIVGYTDNRTVEIEATAIYAGKILRARSQVITLVP
jgi:hypothetical protein